MRYFTISLFALLFMSCNPIEKQIKAAEAEVIRLHDVETMPKMGKLFSLSKKLKSYKLTIDSTSQDTILFTSIDTTIKDLNKAEEDMMQWMKSYGEAIQGIDTITPEEQLNFYKKEVANMEELKKLMFASISSAENILNKQ